MENPPNLIRDRARKIVNSVALDEVGSWRWIKRLVAATIRDYRGRFLYELIQNGFDAHPRDARDGRIAIHFYDDEGPHGALYVANGGRPLSRSNFEKMASLGDSDKAIGVGIGNKGVGFKSVFQICAAPEVFSAAGVDDPGFSGFTFRFGTKGDLAAYQLDDDVAAKVEAELSLSLLTVPLDIIPARAAELRAEGYVTVLRLPAISRQAAAEIRERLERLVASRSPIMLFLDRLQSLSIRQSDDAQPILLQRREEHDGALTTVVLNETERYLLFQDTVSNDELKVALREAVAENSLDEAWLKWDEDAAVSVAVGDGWLVSDPAAFTFLPMGHDASSPFSGHMNAPFITDFARLSLNAEHPVNRLLLNKIAALCLSAVDAVIALDGDANTVVDLMAWDQSRSDPLEAALADRGVTQAQEFARLPARSGGWQSVRELAAWPNTGCAVITAELVVQTANASLLDTERVDTDRLARFEELICELTPNPVAAASWVEKVAIDLLAHGGDLTVWERFYDDLPLIFDSGEALSGLNVILTQDMELAPADQPAPSHSSTRSGESRRRAVFFSPRSAATDDDDAVDSDVDVKPPRSLARRLVFLHPGLNWRGQSGNTPGRRFLQREGLARQFRVASLLNLLGSILAGQTSDTVKRDALVFASNLFAKNPTRHAKELAAVGLFVPTIAGPWIRSARAYFSNGWPVDGAEELTALADGAPTAESEFAELPGRLLAKPSALQIASVDLNRWCTFLSVLGVRATMPTNEAADPRRITGQSLAAWYIGHIGLPRTVPPAVGEQWERGISTTGNFHHRATPFSTKDPIRWFVGQHEIEDLPTQLRRAYGRLVALTLPELSDDYLWSTWRRDRPGGYSTSVESPLLAFIKNAQWVPIIGPGGGTDRAFCATDDSWYIGPEDLMAAAYSPLIEPRLRGPLERVVPSSRRSEVFGFLNWQDENDAARLIDHLTDLHQRADIPETAGEHFRMSLAAAWAAVGNPAVETRPTLDESLLVERSGQIWLQSKEAGLEETLFVSGRSDQSASARLVRELGWPTVMVESSETQRLDEVAGVLRSCWQERVHVTSDWELEVLVNGKPWRAHESDPHLTTLITWLPLLLACVMRFPRTSGLRVGRQLPRVLDGLARIRLVQAERLAIATHGGDHRLPARLHGVLPIPGTTPTLLSEGIQNPPTWTQLDHLIRGALELLGQERFSTEISLAIHELRTHPDHPASRPLNGEIADVLQVGETQINEVEHVVFGAVDGIIGRLTLIAPCVWPAVTPDEFAASLAEVRSRDELVHSLAARCDADEAKAKMILEAASDCADADSLRRRLNIPVLEFNESLSKYFPSLPLVDNGVEQRNEFNMRMAQRKPEIRDRLRRTRFPRFRRGELQKDWPHIRNLDFVEPDSRWAKTYDELGNHLIDERIDAQILDLLGPLPVSDLVLPDWSDVQSVNGKSLRTKLSEACRTVRAWCDRHRVAAPSAWASEDVDVAAREALDQVGALDFAPLTDQDIAHWLARIGRWPDGMALYLDPKAHGLTEADMEAQQSAEAAARAVAARAARQVQFQGIEIDLDASMSTLVDHVHNFLSTEPTSLQTAYRTASVRKHPELSGIRSPSLKNRQRAGGVFVPRLSQHQTSAIGLVGEMVAYHWLRQRDPGIVDESCWKSGNARFVLEGVKGDDGLGFDIEVPRRGGSVMYEVKASIGEPKAIELGETEVRCAQEFSRSERWRLLVVGDVLSTEPRVHMLPNPFHRNSDALFRFVGNSVRLKFHLGDGSTMP